MNEYSGKFVLRISSELHKKLTDISIRKRASLNSLCVSLLNKGLGLEDDRSDISTRFEPIINKLRSKFKDRLAGVVLFGSQATGEATESSDIDILIVLEDSISLNRSLYSWWDSEIVWDDGEMNPHFVTYPKNIDTVTGLWFEIAISGKIIYQKNVAVSQIISKLKKFIADGRVRRYISNGHPYWVKEGQNEK